ncbi:MAG TPA: tetratricopeptide repeat protein, partial [Rhizomicrobium sp.]|nr:tetratricopeptide repeat protein [Rhizomicrobium sp.]
LSRLNAGALSDAESLGQRAFQRDPQNADTLQFMGLLRQTQGRDKEAEDFYRRSLAVVPGQPGVHFNLGMLLYRRARLADALREFECVLQLKPGDFDTLLMCGHVHQAAGQVKAAEEAFRAAIRAQPASITARQYLGGLLADDGRGEEAERVLREALALQPRDRRQIAALQQFLGVALKRQRRLNEALQQFDAAEATLPDIATVDHCRGLALQDMGDMEGAIRSYRRALARNPLNTVAQQELNKLLYRLGRDDEFLVSLDDAARKSPTSISPLLLKGDFLFKTGELAKAAEAYEQAARLMPEAALPHDMLGVIHARQNRFAEAVREHERAVELSPDNAQAWTNFAESLLRAKDPERARGAAERAIEIADTHQMAIALWSLALRQLEDPREHALNDYEALVQVFDLPPPEGYSGMETFNRDLDTYLDPFHRDSRAPLEQTLRAGTQNHDNLIGRGHPPVERLRACIDEALQTYISRMKESADHLLFRRRTRNVRYQGSWTARLSDCGYHTNHVHPFGWISSCYYVSLPDEVDDPVRQQGWIKFGEPSFDIGLTNPICRTVKPQVGRLVLFPSYMWHGTIPFRSSQHRTTIAFDAIPG